jgi:hypothetical protein
VVEGSAASEAVALAVADQAAVGSKRGGDGS